MARAGAGGGGRSSGGGGNRSMGGRSGGGYNRGGISSGGSSRGGAPPGGGRRPPPPPPPRRRGMSPMGGAFMGYSMGRRAAGGNGGGHGGSPSPNNQQKQKPGCLIPIIVAVVLLLLIFLVPVLFNSGSSGNVTASTINREPLPVGAIVENGYYTDELDWIGNSTTLTTGMKNFYKQTGVQPYLYLTDTIDGSHSPTEAQVEQFAYDTYDNLFADEAHLLLIFFEYGDAYHTWYVAGTQAKTVLDSEAMDILLDCIDRYYYDQSLTDEQMFSKAFDEAGERIMTVTRSPWIPVLIVAGILAILTVVFLWWRSHKKQKNLEAEQTQQILNTPLETFGDTDVQERAKKYDDQNQ